MYHSPYIIHHQNMDENGLPVRNDDGIYITSEIEACTSSSVMLRGVMRTTKGDNKGGLGAGGAIM